FARRSRRCLKRPGLSHGRRARRTFRTALGSIRVSAIRRTRRLTSRMTMENTLRDSERDYWENRLGKDVPLNSVGYHGLSDAFVAWLYRIRAARFTRAVRPFARPGLRVLDIGSGGGFYIALWRQLGVTDVTASDLTQASLDAIARRFPGTSTVRFDAG